MALSLTALQPGQMHWVQAMFPAEFLQIPDDDLLSTRIDEAMMGPLKFEKVLPAVLVRPASMAANPAVCDSQHVSRVQTPMAAEGGKMG